MAADLRPLSPTRTDRPSLSDHLAEQRLNQDLVVHLIIPFTTNLDRARSPGRACVREADRIVRTDSGELGGRTLSAGKLPTIAQPGNQVTM